MNIFSFYKRKIINSILLCAIFFFGAATLLFHNAAIRDEAFAYRAEEKRDEQERAALRHEAAYFHFSLNALRHRARELGFVPITSPRFIRRGEEKLPLAVLPKEY